MRLIRHPDAAAFLSSAGDFLYREEEANSLILGVALTLQRDSNHYGTVPWFASVEEGGKVVAAAMHTPPYNLLVSPGPAGTMKALVADAMQASAPFPGVYGQTGSAQTAAEAWAQISRHGFHQKCADRVHMLGAVLPVPQASGQMRELAPVEVPLFCSWLSAFGKEVRGLVSGAEAVKGRMGFHQAWVWDDGGPVCMASWGRETTNTACIYGVYTPPDKRGRGYATNLVAGLSRHLLAGGKRSCVLITDLANPVSNSIYSRMGYIPVCDFNEYRFE